MKQIYFFLNLFFLFFCMSVEAQSCPTLTDTKGAENTINLDCANISSSTCLDLIANFSNLNDTGSYTSSSVAYSPKLPYNSGTPVGIYDDEKYVKRINFSDAAIFGSTPFNFSFQGNVFPSLLISSNGFITFNQLYQEGDFSTGDISGHPIPDAYLPGLSVFGVLADLDFTDQNGSEIYYKVEGAAPCRTFTISFYRGKIAGTNQYVTSQIVLNELSNKIQIFIENKPVPDASARYKESLVGITDNTGGGTAAPERNTGVWAAQNEGWQFSPSGRLIAPTYEWYRDGVLLTGAKYGNKKQVNVCPVNPIENYQVKATYALSSGVKVSFTKDIKTVYNTDYPLAADYTKTFCTGDAEPVYQRDFYANLTSNPISNFNFKFYGSNANSAAGRTPDFDPSQPLNKNFTYYVRVESKTTPTCYRIAVLKLGNQNAALLTNSVQICDANNDGVEENYILSKLLCQLFSPGLKYSNPRFFINSSTSAVTRANLTAATEIYVEITNECGVVKLGPVSVNFTTAPAVNTFASPVMINLCDVVSGSNPPKRETNFDWGQYFKENNINLSPDLDIFKTSVFLSKANAKDNVGAINYINEGLPNTDPVKDYVYTVYVRVENEVTDTCLGSCYSIIELPVKVKFNKIILNVKDADADNPADDAAVFDTEDADIYLCKNDSRTINLETDAQSVIKITNPVDGAGIYTTYHNTQIEADNLADNVGVPKNQTIAANVNTKTYFLRYRLGNTVEDSCYVVKRLNYRFIQFNINKKVNVCSSDVNRPLKILLSDYSNYILSPLGAQNPKPTIEYFSESTGTDRISEINLSSSPVTIFVKVTSGYNTGCSEIIPVEFSAVQSPQLLNTQLGVNVTCDNNNDNQEIYDLTSLENQIINNTSGSYVIEFYRNYNAANNTFSNLITTAQAQNYPVTSGLTVYVKVLSKGTACYTKGEIKFNVDLSTKSAVLNDDVALIQCNISGQVSYFNLNEAVPKLYSSVNPDFNTYVRDVKFYFTEADALKDINAISPEDGYAVYKTQPRKIIWARFVNISGCYSVKSFVLKIIENIRFSGTPPLIPLCDDNLDGIYSFNLRDWLNQKIAKSTPTSSFLSDYDATLGATYTFYYESSDSTPLTSAEENAFQPGPNARKYVYVKADGNGCSTMMKLTFDFGDLTVYSFTHPPICKEGTADLTMFENDIKLQPSSSFEYYRTENDLIAGQNKIQNPATYTYEGINLIYLKIIKPNGACPRKATIALSLKTTPVFTMQNEYYFCENGGSVTAFPNVSQIYLAGLNPQTYIWTLPDNSTITNQYPNSTLQINKKGNYTLTIIADNGCGSTVDFVVKTYDVPQIYKIVVEGDKVTVLATAKNNSRTILYSTDGITWQKSYIFYNIAAGVQAFYVKYEDNYLENGCVGKGEAALVLSKNNVITPNGDGYNDTWKVEHLDFFSGEKAGIKIFDRYNKLVFEQESNTELIWEGYYGGRVLPTSTYWYVLKLPDGREVTGWILLKNRD